MVDFLQPGPRDLSVGFMDNLTQLIQPNSLWVLVPLCSIVYLALQLWPSRKGARTTPLAGPPNTSWLLGVARRMVDDAAMVEGWVEEYGPVFRVPAALGSSTVVLTDPAAVAHFYANDAGLFTQRPVGKQLIELFVSRKAYHLCSGLIPGLSGWEKCYLGRRGRPQTSTESLVSCL